MADHYGHGVVLFRLLATAVAISGGTVALVFLGIWEDVRGLLVGTALACVVIGLSVVFEAWFLFLVGVPLLYLAGLYAVVLVTSPTSRRRSRHRAVTALVALGALIAVSHGAFTVTDYYVVAQEPHIDAPSTLGDYLGVLAFGGVQTIVGAFVLARLAHWHLDDESELSQSDSTEAP